LNLLFNANNSSQCSETYRYGNKIGQRYPHFMIDGGKVVAEFMCGEKPQKKGGKERSIRPHIKIAFSAHILSHKNNPKERDTGKRGDKKSGMLQYLYDSRFIDWIFLNGILPDFSVCVGIVAMWVRQTYGLGLNG